MDSSVELLELRLNAALRAKARDTIQLAGMVGEMFGGKPGELPLTEEIIAQSKVGL
ncbi:MAG TPA: hypothetical protein VMF06_15925 [Candidatus Limnocylindria bacterium]|nr:hypothetical protein [Candidatus Limnocylindria bacterium]